MNDDFIIPTYYLSPDIFQFFPKVDATNPIPREDGFFPSLLVYLLDYSPVVDMKRTIYKHGICVLPQVHVIRVYMFKSASALQRQMWGTTRPCMKMEMHVQRNMWLTILNIIFIEYSDVITR